MDIHNMLNGKGSAAAAAAAAVTEEHLSQHVAHISPTSNASEAGWVLEGISGHSSDIPSRPTRLLQSMPYAPSPVHRSSQGDSQPTMPLLASSPEAPRPGYENGYAHSPDHPETQQQPGQSLIPGVSGSGEAVKAFACGTCYKGFARRSDLARHGQSHSC